MKGPWVLGERHGQGVLVVEVGEGIHEVPLEGSQVGHQGGEGPDRGIQQVPQGSQLAGEVLLVGRRPWSQVACHWVFLACQHPYS